MLEMVLLDPKIKIKRSPTLRGIFAGWRLAQGKLHFDANEAVLPENFTMVKLVRVFGVELSWTHEEERSLLALLASKEIRELKDPRTRFGRWRTP